MTSELNAGCALRRPPDPCGLAAADRRARAVDLRWAARCEEMEAVLDDLAAALLPRPDITHVVGYTCEGIDCRYDKGLTPTDHDVYPHLHMDAVVAPPPTAALSSSTGPRFRLVCAA